jgi:hypothetical protein
VVSAVERRKPAGLARALISLAHAAAQVLVRPKGGKVGKISLVDMAGSERVKKSEVPTCVGCAFILLPRPALSREDIDMKGCRAMARLLKGTTI